MKACQYKAFSYKIACYNVICNYSIYCTIKYKRACKLVAYYSCTIQAQKRTLLSQLRKRMTPCLFDN